MRRLDECSSGQTRLDKTSENDRDRGKGVRIDSSQKMSAFTAGRYHRYSSVSGWPSSRYPSLSFLQPSRRSWQRRPHIYSTVPAIKHRLARISGCLMAVFSDGIIFRLGIPRQSGVREKSEAVARAKLCLI